MANEHKTPRITMMGEEIPYEEMPGNGALNWDARFAPVRLTPRSINTASTVVPLDVWHKVGIVRWLQSTANEAARNMAIDDTSGMVGKLRYIFEFDHNGPILKDVRLG